MPTTGHRITKQPAEPVMLTADQRHVLRGALSLAAAKYRENATTARAAGPQYGPIAEQFEQQAIDADRAAATLDDPTAPPATAQPTPADVPPDPEGMNDDRAEWARAAVVAFMRTTGSDPCDAVSDLIADLHHLCDREPDRYETFDGAIERADTHYTEETTEEPVTDDERSYGPRR